MENVADEFDADEFDTDEFDSDDDDYVPKYRYTAENIFFKHDLDPEIAEFLRMDDLVLEVSPLSDPKDLGPHNCPVNELSQSEIDALLKTSAMAQLLYSQTHKNLSFDECEALTAPVRLALNPREAGVDLLRRRTGRGDRTKEYGDSPSSDEDLSVLDAWVTLSLKKRPNKMTALEKHRARKRLRGSVDALTAIEETVLFLSCQYGFCDLAEFLLSVPADAEATGMKGITPLMVAAHEGCSSIVKLLIAHGVDIDARTSQRYLRELGESDKVSVEDLGSDHVAFVYPEGTTALMYACMKREKDVVSILLEAGANFEYRNMHGRTALMEAANAKQLEIVKLLVSQGASTKTEPDRRHDSPLTLASAAGSSEIVQFLLDSGAIDHDNKLVELHGSLIRAANKGRIEVVRLLLGAGAQINNPDDTESPLLAAVSHKKVKMARFLLEQGANIERVYKGFTPLMEAVKQGDINMVRLLLSHGANVEARTDEGNSVLSLLPAQNYEDLLELFKQVEAES